MWLVNVFLCLFVCCVGILEFFNLDVAPEIFVKRKSHFAPSYYLSSPYLFSLSIFVGSFVVG